jgi:hypothetical protein
MINQGDMDETNQKIQSWKSRAGEFGEFGELAVIPRELCMEKAGVNEVRGPPPHVFGQLFRESRTKRPPSDPFCQSYADPE